MLALRLPMDSKPVVVDVPPPAYSERAPATEKEKIVRAVGGTRVPGIEKLFNEEKLLLTEVLEEPYYGFRLQVAKKYRITNSAGNLLYSASEDDATVWNKILFQQNRNFKMSLVGPDNQVALKLNRFMSSQVKLFGHSLQIQDPEGITFANVHQTTMETFRTPDFKITDEAGNDQLKLNGPVHPFPSFAEVLFQIVAADTCESVGSINRIYPSTSWFSTTKPPRSIEVVFSKDLDVKMKAAILGAAVLIDIMVFD